MNEGLGDDLEEMVYKFNPTDYKKIRKTVENFGKEEKRTYKENRKNKGH